MKNKLIIMVLVAGFVGATLCGRPEIKEGSHMIEEGNHIGLPLRGQTAYAADTTWGFDTSTDYTYDTSKIEITGGVAKLKDLGVTIKDDTIIEYNSAFVAGDTTGRGYANTASGPDVSLVLDTVGVSQYVPTGTFTSRIFDTASGCGNWQRINASVVNGDLANSDSLFDSGLVGLWHLNEGYGTTTVDASGNGNTGTLAAAPATPTWTTSAKLGANCLSFDGGDYVNCGTSATLNPSVFSISLWLKFTDSTSWQGVVSASINEANYKNWYLTSIETPKLRLSCYTGSGQTQFFAQSNNVLNSGNWHYIVGTYNGTNSKMYVDTIFQTASGTGTMAVAGYGLYMGRTTINFDGSYFNGLIDEVAIWNRALDSSEIADHYNSGAGKELHRAAKFQIRSGDTVGELASCGFAGSRGDSTSYYNGTNENLVSCANFDTTHRFAQYKAYLNASTDSTRTPTVASVALAGATGNVFDNTKGDFDLGTYSTTDTSPVSRHLPLATRHSSVGLSKMPNGGYNSYGTYTSHVIDGEGSPDWTTLNFTLGGTEIDASENGLVSLWHMNGDWKDSRGTNNGTPYGATFNTSSQKLGAGCGNFDGDDCVGISNEASFDFERTTAFTTSFWIKALLSYPDPIINKLEWAVGAKGWRILSDPSNTLLTFTLADNHTVTDITLSVNNVSDNQWHHVVFTYNGNGVTGGVKGYLDGVLQVEGGGGNLSTSTLNDVALIIGGYAGAYYLNGLIDEVAIYNRALSASEVMNHYQKANPGTVKFQCRAGSTVGEVESGEWRGPDSTSATFYESTGADLGFQFDTKQYLQYRMYLEGR